MPIKEIKTVAKEEHEDEVESPREDISEEDFPQEAKEDFDVSQVNKNVPTVKKRNRPKAKKRGDAKS